MDGYQLYLLGRKLMKAGEDAIPESGFHDLAASGRMVMFDALEHSGTSISEITARTGIPQSQVSATIARLRDERVVVTAPDPQDRRRTLVRLSPDIGDLAAKQRPAPIEPALTALLGGSRTDAAALRAALETAAALLGKHR